MFEFKCYEYLKELTNDSKNTTLREEFKQFLISHKEEIEPFIIQGSLQGSQKELFLQILNELNLDETPSNSMNQNQQNDDFSSVIMNYFNSWRDEYLKLRQVNMKCIEICKDFITKYLLQNTQLIDFFKDLPTNENENLEAFKNHVLNLLSIALMDSADYQINTIKKINLGFIKKYTLIHKFERIRTQFSKKQFNINKFEELLLEVLQLKRGIEQ